MTLFDGEGEEMMTMVGQMMPVEAEKMASKMKMVAGQTMQVLA